MKKLLIPFLVLAVVGCVPFSTHVFRTEQLAVNLAHAAYVGYTNALPTLHITEDQSNAVKQARLKFAASVGTVESLRLAYETNSAIKPTLQAAIDSLVDQSSNVVWLIEYFKAQK